MDESQDFYSFATIIKTMAVTGFFWGGIWLFKSIYKSYASDNSGINQLQSRVELALEAFESQEAVITHELEMIHEIIKRYNQEQFALNIQFKTSPNISNSIFSSYETIPRPEFIEFQRNDEMLKTLINLVNQYPKPQLLGIQSFNELIDLTKERAEHHQKVLSVVHHLAPSLNVWLKQTQQQLETQHPTQSILRS